MVETASISTATASLNKTTSVVVPNWDCIPQYGIVDNNNYGMMIGLLALTGLVLCFDIYLEFR